MSSPRSPRHPTAHTYRMGNRFSETVENQLSRSAPPRSCMERLTPSNVRSLRGSVYCAAPRLRGVRYRLCMGRHEHSRQMYSVLSGKTGTFQVELCADRSYFYGTVFEGVLVQPDTEGPLVFFAYACQQLRGKPVRHSGSALAHKRIVLSAFPTRGKKAEDGAIVSRTPGLEFRAHRVVPLTFAHTVVSDGDGLLFLPLHGGRNHPVLRWTPTETLRLSQPGNLLLGGASVEEAFPDARFAFVGDALPGSGLVELEVTRKSKRLRRPCYLLRYREVEGERVAVSGAEEGGPSTLSEAEGVLSRLKKGRIGWEELEHLLVAG